MISKKTFLVVVVVVVAAGVLVWHQWQAPAEEEQPSTEEAELSQEQAQPPAEETADWKTYRNEEYRFEVKYPKDWRTPKPSPGALGGPGEIVFSKSLDENNYCQVTVVTYSTELGSDEEEITDLRNKGYEESAITLGSVPAVKLTKSQAGIADAIYFLYNENNFRITRNRGFGTELENECIAVFEQILSTFRFLEVGCDFSKPVDLRKTDKYGIFGDDEFDTIVCGYFNPKITTVFGQEQTNAYFNIIKFYDEEFKESIEKGIQEGNTVNSKSNEIYEFNLGCFKNGKIVGIQYDEDAIYVDEATQEKILNSTPEHPVSFILSFGEHLGTGCVCCNLAHKIRVY